METREQCNGNSEADCRYNFLAVSDTMDILKGKWKIHILVGLTFGPMQYGELLRTIKGIGTKMLARELRELEMNNLISRTVNSTKPITVTYALTPYGKSLDKLIQEIMNWGLKHRQIIAGKVPVQE